MIPSRRVSTCSQFFAEKVAIDLNSVGDKLADLRTFILGRIDQTTQFKRAEEKTHAWQLQNKDERQNRHQEPRACSSHPRRERHGRM